MGRFKVGDRVRCVAHSDWGSKGEVGEIYTVTDILKSGDVELDGTGSGVMTSRFELAYNSPTRTVTRREIVPYTMNAGGGEGTPEIRIKRSVRGGVDIGFGADRSDSHFNANSLRAAARIFNEIADVLDEQSAEAQKEAA